MIKQIFLTVIIAFCIGLVIFLFMQKYPTSTLSNPSASKSTQTTGSTPLPLTIPSPSPIEETSDLKAEINKLTPKDYSSEFQSLKGSL